MGSPESSHFSPSSGHHPRPRYTSPGLRRYPPSWPPGSSTAPSFPRYNQRAPFQRYIRSSLGSKPRKGFLPTSSPPTLSAETPPQPGGLLALSTLSLRAFALPVPRAWDALLSDIPAAHPYCLQVPAQCPRSREVVHVHPPRMRASLRGQCLAHSRRSVLLDEWHSGRRARWQLCGVAVLDWESGDLRCDLEKRLALSGVQRPSAQ